MTTIPSTRAVRFIYLPNVAGLGHSLWNRQGQSVVMHGSVVSLTRSDRRPGPWYRLLDSVTERLTLK